MTTRADYRDALSNRIVAIEDSGYGDFEFSQNEYNTYLDLAVARLFPALYKRVGLLSQVAVPYGTSNYGRVAVDLAEQVFLIEDAVELEPVAGWEIRPGAIVKLDVSATYNVYYYDAFVLPNDDVTATGIPSQYKPLIVLGALIEALESRMDTGVRPDFQAGYQQTPLLVQLQKHYDDLRAEMGMSLPVVRM